MGGNMKRFNKKEEKNKVGRPKLADSKLKKTSLIMCIVCVILSLVLLSVGAYKLNIIPNTNKLKGAVSCSEIPLLTSSTTTILILPRSTELCFIISRSRPGVAMIT